MNEYTSRINADNIPPSLPDGAARVLKFIAKAGSITAREAMIDLDMAQGTLTKNICRIENSRYTVYRKPCIHPVSGTRYTRYYVRDALARPPVYKRKFVFA